MAAFFVWRMRNTASLFKVTIETVMELPVLQMSLLLVMKISIMNNELDTGLLLRHICKLLKEDIRIK